MFRLATMWPSDSCLSPLDSLSEDFFMFWKSPKPGQEPPAEGSVVTSAVILEEKDKQYLDRRLTKNFKKKMKRHSRTYIESIELKQQLHIVPFGGMKHWVQSALNPLLCFSPPVCHF